MIGDQDSITWRQFFFIQKLYGKLNREWNEKIINWVQGFSLKGAQNTITTLIEEVNKKK